VRKIFSSLIVFRRDMRYGKCSCGATAHLQQSGNGVQPGEQHGNRVLLLPLCISEAGTEYLARYSVAIDHRIGAQYLYSLESWLIGRTSLMSRSRLYRIPPVERWSMLRPASLLLQHASSGLRRPAIDKVRAVPSVRANSGSGRADSLVTLAAPAFRGPPQLPWSQTHGNQIGGRSVAAVIKVSIAPASICNLACSGEQQFAHVPCIVRIPDSLSALQVGSSWQRMSSTHSHRR
jgi:hypothetical protein